MCEQAKQEELRRARIVGTTCAAAAFGALDGLCVPGRYHCRCCCVQEREGNLLLPAHAPRGLTLSALLVVPKPPVRSRL